MIHFYNLLLPDIIRAIQTLRLETDQFPPTRPNEGLYEHVIFKIRPVSDINIKSEVLVINYNHIIQPSKRGWHWHSDANIRWMISHHMFFTSYRQCYNAIMLVFCLKRKRRTTVPSESLTITQASHFHYL